MFFGLDFLGLFLLMIVFFLCFVVSNPSYLFVIGGVILFSLVIFLCMVWHGFLFFGAIFMMVYSGGMLLLVLYVSAMLGDYEVQGTAKTNFFVFVTYFIFCGLGVYNVFDFYSGFSYYSFGGGYLVFCVLCLGLSLVSVLELLLKKNY
uniref:NADH dehydrogenase subunit 6 n=1 Tax=Botrylloides violaceus TaxID=581057 RepID=A0A024GWQ6_BOTVI|nr:NADH dehydrogenase subunit 6 [Botrylloides violaceus]CCO25693.1 NADH dehydrogenase subunit 6 [Botrylloides violaceus]